MKSALDTVPGDEILVKPIEYAAFSWNNTIEKNLLAWIMEWPSWNRSGNQLVLHEVII